MAVYDELGVRPYINARAPHTRFGGAIMPDVVVQAMAEAAGWGVDMEELQTALHSRIAQLTRNEAAFISGGAASGLALATAACMAGRDRSRIERLPNTRGMRNEVVVPKASRFDEEICLQAARARIVEIGTSRGTSEDDLAGALGPSTAAVVTCDWEGCLPIERTVAIAGARNVPVIVDAAGDVPPVDNFWRYTRELGADAVVVSGGKGLCGPQATGLVLGKSDLIDACVANGSPHRAIGRTMKVAKEDMVGIYVAVRHLIETFDAQMEQLRTSADRMKRALSSIEGVSISRDPPYLLLELGACPGFDSADRVMAELRSGDPSILALCRGTTLWLNVQTLAQGQDEIVTRRVMEVLSPGG